MLLQLRMGINPTCPRPSRLLRCWGGNRRGLSVTPAVWVRPYSAETAETAERTGFELRPPVDRMRQVRLLFSVCGMRKNGRWPTLPSSRRLLGLSARSSLVTVLDRDFTCAVTSHLLYVQ